MHNKIRKYNYGSQLFGVGPNVANSGMQTGGTPIIGGATPGYAPTGSTGANAGIGMAISGLSSTLGQQIGGEWGNAIGAVGGNLASNMLSSGSFKEGLSNFAGLDMLGKSNMSKFGTKDFNGFGNMGNLAAGVASGILDRGTSHQRTSGKYGSVAGAADMAGGLIGQFGNYSGYGALGQLGMSAVNRITGGTDGMTIADSLMGSSSLAAGLMAVNPYVGAAYIALSGLNSATGKTTQKNLGNDFMSKEQLSSLWGSYGKSEADHRDASKYGNKKYGGLSRLTGQFGKANRKVGEDNERINTLLDIYDRAELGKIRGEQMADINALDYRLNTFGGYDQYGTRIGRKGMKLPGKEDIMKVREIISMKEGGKQKKYNSHYNGEKCNTTECAQFSNETLRDEGYDTHGNAWNLKNAKLIFNGYKGLNKPRKYNVREVTNYNHQAAQNFLKNFDSKTLDPEQIYIVNMYVNNSPAQESAYNEGRDSITSTHTGYLYNDGKDWNVVHNIHGTIHKDRFFNIQGSRGKYGVTAIYKPTKGLFGWGFLGLKNGGTIDSFKKGGQMNVIPEGALHARKNHMEGAGKDYTHKGIPVMDKNGEQQAEIERNEIIFSLEVTQKLERLKNDGSDEAAIKAGKLLVDEIFHNTDDRTGLIAEVIGQNTTVLKEGGVLLAQEPEIESELDAEEPVGMEEVEYYESGGVLEEGDNAISAEEPTIGIDDEVETFETGGKPRKHFVYKPKLKPKFEEWIQDVNPNFLNDNYDIKMAYETLPFEDLERWKWAVNSDDPEFYMDYTDNDGNYVYHLDSVAELDNGDFVFLKKGKEDTNPELHFETDMYHNGENGFKNTHDLKFEGDRYYYRKKKSFKKEDGGIIEQINNLSPDKLQELEHILKYLNQ